MKNYGSPTIESVGGGGHEPDRPFWFYFYAVLNLCIYVAAVAVAVCLVDSPKAGTPAE